MKNLLTKKITDAIRCDLSHEKIQKVVTYDTEEIDVQIKYFNTNSGVFKSFYNIKLSATIYDVDKSKWVYIDEYIGTGDFDDWKIEFDGEIKSIIESIKINFINQHILLTFK